MYARNLQRGLCHPSCLRVRVFYVFIGYDMGTQACLRVSLFTCVHITRVCICVCIYIYIWVYTHVIVHVCYILHAAVFVYYHQKKKMNRSWKDKRNKCGKETHNTHKRFLPLVSIYSVWMYICMCTFMFHVVRICIPGKCWSLYNTHHASIRTRFYVHRGSFL